MVKMITFSLSLFFALLLLSSMKITPGWVNGATKFVFFMYLWTINFVSQLRLSIVSGTVSTWYLHHDDPNKPANLVKNALSWSWNAIGTVSLAALIVAIAEWIEK